jgi:hypothetical protein
MSRSQPTGAARLGIEEMADDARAILDAEGWSSAHVVGTRWAG